MQINLNAGDTLKCYQNFDINTDDSKRNDNFLNF